MENNKIIEHLPHPSSYLILHEDNSSNQLAHEISLIHLFLNFQPKEPLQLRNMFVQIEKYGKICDRDGCYPIRSGLTKTINISYPQAMCDLVQDSNVIL